MKRLIALLMLIIAIATLALMKSDSDYMKNVYEKVLGYIDQKQTQEGLDSKIVPQRTQQNKQELVVAPRETRIEPKQRFSTRSSEISASQAIIALNQIPFSDDKVNYIRNNLHSMPNNLRLSEVTKMLRSISFSDDKVQAVGLLKNKISKYYSDTEYSNFIRTIPFSSDKVKVANILHRK